jgi:hypothetical protein
MLFTPISWFKGFNDTLPVFIDAKLQNALTIVNKNTVGLRKTTEDYLAATYS